MLQVGFTRVVRTAFNLSNAKYKDCRCIYKLMGTESATKHGIDEQHAISKTDRNNVSSISNISHKLSLDPYNLTDSLKKVLCNIDSDQLTKNTTYLLDFGFHNDIVVKFIEEQPSLFRIKHTELNKLLNLWQQVLHNEELIIELLSMHPHLIEMMGPLATERIGFLLSYFKNMKTVAISLINTPNIIYENKGSLKAKLDFLHSHNIPMKKVASCSALELSLLEMRTRFAFLERAGVYKKRVDLFKKDLKTKNASVLNILCTDDKLFAEVIAKLTLVEYEAFIDLYRWEQKLIDEDYSDNDDSE